MILKSLLFSVINFALTLVISMVVAAIIWIIAKAVHRENKSATE